jgi:hypothetical protein
MIISAELRLALEARIEQHLAVANRLIEALDQIDSDTDLEPDSDREDGHDLEDDRADYEHGWAGRRPTRILRRSISNATIAMSRRQLRKKAIAKSNRP